MSPIKNDRIKRSALGNLTNAVIATDSDEILKKGAIANTLTSVKNLQTLQAATTSDKNATRIQPISSRTRAAAKVVKKGTKVNSELLPPPSAPYDVKSKVVANVTTVRSKPAVEVPSRASRRISNEFEKTEESLYVSALEDISSDVSRLSSDTHRVIKTDSTSSALSHGDIGTPSPSSARSSECGDSDVSDVFYKSCAELPPGVHDFDKENWNDPFQVSNYASNIFKYLREREANYKIKDYMSEQPELSKWMRSLLIDWMVEVQESFELNHETLYLAVKIVDSYLGKARVTKDSLQLLGAAALLIACKYDERTPPLIDDFLFICDGAYKRTQLLKMEITVFKSIDFDLAFPLSYRFLRRYARVSGI